jgi:hypothetical protein
MTLGLFKRRRKQIIDNNAVPANQVKRKTDLYDIDYRVLTGALTDLDQIKQSATALKDRATMYNCMTQLKSDAIIGPAIEIYATNATGANADGDVIWAVPINDDDVSIMAAKAANERMKAWKLNWRAYSHMIELVTYSNLYLKTTEFVTPRTKDDSQGVLSLNQRNPNQHWDVRTDVAISPAIIYELRHDDEPSAFCVDFSLQDNISETSYDKWCRIKNKPWSVQSSDSVVHIVYNLSLYPSEIEVEDSDGITPYTIYQGDPLFIDAYVPAQILSLLEDAIVANRVTKSALLRILQLEVGDCSPEEERRLLDQLKRQMEHKLAANTNTGSASSYADPGPLEKIVYTVTRDGKGVINLETLGGDVNIRDIVDLDWYKQKITSITDVSPGNLGQSTDEEGTGGATILTQNNIRLYRKIISLQHAYSEGIREALNKYFVKNGLPQYKDRFEVKMQPPVGPEDETKSELQSNAVSRANDIIALLENIGVTDSQVKIKSIKGQLDVIDPAIYSMLNKTDIIESAEGEAETEENPFI